MAVKTKLTLFNSLVLPILYYSCEVWGFCKADQLEKMYLGFLKSILGVRKTVPTSFIYRELGLFPMAICRKIRILKYWFKIVNMKDTNPVKITYNQLVRDLEEDSSVTNWASLLKQLLEENGCGNIWLQQNTDNPKLFLNMFEQRVKDIYLQNNHDAMTNLSDHRLYKYLTHKNEISGYLINIKEKYIRNALSKLRLGSHNLMVERGRWQTPIIDFTNRICTECQEIEDEYHFVLKCKRYTNLRKQYIPKTLIDKPNMFELIKLVDSKDVNVLRKFGIFCHKAFSEYNAVVV